MRTRSRVVRFSLKFLPPGEWRFNSVYSINMKYVFLSEYRRLIVILSFHNAFRLKRNLSRIDNNQKLLPAGFLRSCSNLFPTHFQDNRYLARCAHKSNNLTLCSREIIDKTIHTLPAYLCRSRPRRGKSI